MEAPAAPAAGPAPGPLAVAAPAPLAAPAVPGDPAAAAPAAGNSTSKTVTDTITGEHQHTIVGYSLVKGIGDGEPIASERFTVGGHEWVLLFYPDGKRSSSAEGGPGPGPAAADAAAAAAAQAAAAHHQQLAAAAAAAVAAGGGDAAAQAAQAAAAQAAAVAQAAAAARREAAGDYAALFVALIGEADSPQGVVSTADGRVVRAFHRFTLVDQTGQGRDLTKGRRRDQGAVKISCARSDPAARNCHGYRKFVKRSVLENPNHGFLVNDTIIIRYTIELVVSSGGALARPAAAPARPPPITVPPPSIGRDLGRLLDGGRAADVTFDVEGEPMRAHRIILSARSPVFHALLTGPMREGSESTVHVGDVRAPVFRALLHFAYTDALPDELEGGRLDVPMAQHLLVAADRFQLGRLRTICERRLCETVDTATAATTLALAEQNHAAELKRVCLDYVSRHLQAVMASDGYAHMVSSCPQLQAELLSVIAAAAQERAARERGLRHRHLPPPPERGGAGDGDGEGRRVRPRQE